MTSKKTIEQFFDAVAGEIESLKEQLKCASDVIGCLQVENDDLRDRLRKYENEKG